MNKKSIIKKIQFKAEVGQWGNALAVRLPKIFCDVKDIEKGSVLLLNGLVAIEEESCDNRRSKK